MEQVFERIGLGAEYEEYFITDIDTDIHGLYEAIGEYSNIHELNYLGERLDSLDENQLEFYKAIAEAGEDLNSVKDFINLTFEENMECYTYLPDVKNDYDLGVYYAEELDCLNLSCLDEPTKRLMDMYFDYESYGQDIHLNGTGHFDGDGFVIRDDDMQEFYSSPADIPAPAAGPEMKM